MYTFGKILFDRMCLWRWALFSTTGYRVCRGSPHTPVTSLVKYLSWDIFELYPVCITLENNGSSMAINYLTLYFYGYIVGMTL